MYTSKKPYMYGTGRRKSSVARVHLFPGGTGAITINGRDIDEYFGLETLKLIVNQPFGTTGTSGKFDIIATVAGGGISGQGESLMAPLREKLQYISFGTKDMRTKVVVADFKNDAGIIGAALLGLMEEN